LKDDENQKEYALDGLTQVMAIKSQAVMPYLVPKLTQEPINARALSYLASVAGSALDRDLHRILGVSYCFALGEVFCWSEQCVAVIVSCREQWKISNLVAASLEVHCKPPF